ncbi:MAG: hypothetical protein ACREMA_05705, partial [Longimicrobiales bacterium]
VIYPGRSGYNGAEPDDHANLEPIEAGANELDANYIYYWGRDRLPITAQYEDDSEDRGNSCTPGHGVLLFALTRTSGRKGRLMCYAANTAGPAHRVVARRPSCPGRTPYGRV